jgi:hypothetical protein
MDGMDEKRPSWRQGGLATVLATAVVGAFTIGAGWPSSDFIVFIAVTLGVIAAALAGLVLIKHRRFRFSLALVLLLVVLISELLAIWALTPSRQVPNWTKVKVGMTEAEVEKTMGYRGVQYPGGGGETEWDYYTDHITISFRNGRVTEVLQYGPLK